MRVISFSLVSIYALSSSSLCIQEVGSIIGKVRIPIFNSTRKHICIYKGNNHKKNSDLKYMGDVLLLYNSVAIFHHSKHLQNNFPLP